MSINNIKISEHFNLAEFQCPHCNTVKIHPDLVHMLEQLRILLHDHPIIIGSGYRCKAYNRILYKRINESRVANDLEPLPVAKRSMHTQGRAIDLANHFFTEQDIEGLHDLGFMGIGLGKGKTHLDIRPGNLVTWRYDD